jgi:hypothetical protein
MTLVSASGRRTSLQTFSCLPSAVRPRLRTATAMDAPWRRSAVTPPVRFTVNQSAYSCPREWELLPGCGIRQPFACRRLRYHPFRWKGRSDAGGFRHAQRDLGRSSNDSCHAKWLLIGGNGPLQSPACSGVFKIMFPERSEIDVAFVLANHGLEIRTVVTRQHVPERPPAIISAGSECAPLTPEESSGCDLAVQIRSDGVKIGPVGPDFRNSGHVMYSAGCAGDAHPSLSAAAVQFSVGALHAVSAVDGAKQSAGCAR